ncbi:T9SS type A sorting domain-containing protein [Dyadobacter endophyticus]|uniref:T9SS type A sorting domain-containing protein n=1 Tax=Dyadobacter endophyticus TaxID=1749036 RepID=UPI003CEA9C85
MKPPLQTLLKMVLFYTIFLISTVHTFGQSWNQMIKVTAQNNDASSARTANDEYGSAVSISGNYAIVGSYRESEDGNGLDTVALTGAAYILYNDAGNWVQVKKITAPVRESGDNFGVSVSISGDYAIVGAHQEDDDALETNTLFNAGSAYIFKKDQGGPDNWGLLKKITASTRDVQDRFGYSVSMSGNYAIVSAYLEDDDVNETNTLDNSGSAYIFKKDQGGTDNWGQVKKITASVRGIVDWFGVSVSISGDYAIVGANFEDEDSLENNSLDGSGSAYIFKKDQGGADNWGQVKKVTAADRASGDAFGWSVSIDGNYAIVAAYTKGGYIFKKDQGGIDNWGQVQKRPGGGASVAISGDYAVVGGQSSADFFKKDLGGLDNWGPMQNVSHGGNFGVATSMSGDFTLVGAYSDDNFGSAYIFKLGPPLPVTIITFEAVKKENQVLLSWATTMESNSAYFDVQKSGDGHNWKTLGRVWAAVKSDQVRSYAFTDDNPSDEDPHGQANLYRLKMVDTNGSFAYSRTISLLFGKKLRSILYPNPVSDKLYCDPAEAAKIESITMVNSAGRIMLRSFENTRAGISVDRLTPGIYVGQIKTKAGAVQFQKIIVVR